MTRPRTPGAVAREKDRGCHQLGYQQELQNIAAELRIALSIWATNLIRRQSAASRRSKKGR